MRTLALHFDFGGQPPPDDPDMSRFRRDLSRRLEAVLKASGSGRWRGGRYARGVVTIFLEVADTPSVMEQVQTALSSRGLTARMVVL